MEEIEKPGQRFWPDEKADLHYALSKLPCKYRIVIHMYYYEEYKTKEISEILKVNEATVRTRLARGREKLKELLKEEWAYPYLERAVMTGITRISKESIFSDLNNLKVVTTTSDEYAESFGFTEGEVFTALDEFGMSESKEDVKQRYDGFTFGGKTDIYNPWSIINFLNPGKLGTYWANTGSNSLVGKLIREGSPEIKKTFEELIGGGTIRGELDEQIVYNRLSAKRNSVWSLLLASGYLKAVEVEFTERTGRTYHKLALTNKEVRLMLDSMIRDWFSESDYYNDFIKAFLIGDLKAMNAYMNKVASQTFRYFDTGNQPSESEPERFYHGFVLGLMAELSDRYVITSNRESGFGR